ncbi:hypothetical protein P9112_009744 [Eukaryota sp. TZLM1-RC]
MFSLVLLAKTSLPPVFIILLGGILYHFDFVPASSIPSFNAFIFKICMSARFFQQISDVDLSNDFTTFILTMIVFRLVGFFYSFFMAHLLRRSPTPFNVNLFAIFACTAWQNVIVIGVPLIEDLVWYGHNFKNSEVVHFVRLVGPLDYLIQLPLSTILLGREQGMSFKVYIRKVLSSPPLWSIILGIIFLIFDLPVNPILNNTLSYLDNITKGGAHLLAGACLWAVVEEGSNDVGNYISLRSLKSYGTVGKESFTKTLSAIRRLNKNPEGAGFMILLLFTKLVVAPFIMYFCTNLFDLDEEIRMICLFVSCLPVGIQAFCVAQNFNSAVGAVNKMVVYTTLLLTCTLWCYGLLFEFDF